MADTLLGGCFKGEWWAKGARGRTQDESVKFNYKFNKKIVCIRSIGAGVLVFFALVSLHFLRLIRQKS